MVDKPEMLNQLLNSSDHPVGCPFYLLTPLEVGSAVAIVYCYDVHSCFSKLGQAIENRS